MSDIRFTVNGREVIAHDEDKTLLNFLREDLGLVGTKDGCAKGQCGTCTVIVNDDAVKACTKTVKQLEGAEVQTIEGLAVGGVLHPIQKAFLKLSAYQCGFCTPGVILTTYALLKRSPHPTRAEVQTALAGNLCRCGSYGHIIEAALAVADELE